MRVCAVEVTVETFMLFVTWKDNLIDKTYPVIGKAFMLI